MEEGTKIDERYQQLFGRWNRMNKWNSLSRPEKAETSATRWGMHRKQGIHAKVPWKGTGVSTKLWSGVKLTTVGMSELFRPPDLLLHPHKIQDEPEWLYIWEHVAQQRVEGNGVRGIPDWRLRLMTGELNEGLWKSLGCSDQPALPSTRAPSRALTPLRKTNQPKRKVTKTQTTKTQMTSWME